jgi:hypothetical protein
MAKNRVTMTVPTADEHVLPPTTTAEENRIMYGQRTINLMWEGTQRTITLLATAVVLLVSSYLSISPNVPIELRMVAFFTLVYLGVGLSSSYFTRTNHSKTGGIGGDQVIRSR